MRTGYAGTLAVCSLLLQQFGAIWSYELKQWFPTNAPRHTNAPQDVIRCAAKHIEVKFNQVGFKKFHATNVSQHGTLTISDSIEMFLVGECIISLFRLNKIHCTVALWKIMHEINSNCDVTNSKAHLSQSTVP